MATFEVDNPWKCPRCYQDIVVRHSKYGLCMDCFLPNLIRPEKCSKCGGNLLKTEDKALLHDLRMDVGESRTVCFRCRDRKKNLTKY